MSKRKWISLIVLIVLYLATWIGGWPSHLCKIMDRAQRYWNNGAVADREREELAEKYQFPADDPRIFPKGPHAYVRWCFPILPCILVADSGYQIGPVWGKGGIKLVLYYGFGSVEIVTLNGWIS